MVFNATFNIFQLYCGGQFYEYPEKTTNLQQVNDRFITQCYIDYTSPWYGIRTPNFRGDRHWMCRCNHGGPKSIEDVKQHEITWSHRRHTYIIVNAFCNILKYSPSINYLCIFIRSRIHQQPLDKNTFHIISGCLKLLPIFPFAVVYEHWLHRSSRNVVRMKSI